MMWCVKKKHITSFFYMEVLTLEGYKKEFVDFMLDSNVLKFGDFTLKSGRKSPFFMNAGLYVTGTQLMKLGEYYATAIHNTYGDDFDVVSCTDQLCGPQTDLHHPSPVSVNFNDVAFGFWSQTYDDGVGGIDFQISFQFHNKNVFVKQLFLSNVFTTVEVDVLLGKQFDGHVIDGVNFLFKHNGVEQALNTGIALHVSMLGDEKGDASLTNTLCVLGHHVVAHDLNVAAVALQQKLTNEVGFGVEGNTMVLSLLQPMNAQESMTSRP